MQMQGARSGGGVMPFLEWEDFALAAMGAGVVIAAVVTLTKWVTGLPDGSPYLTAASVALGFAVMGLLYVFNQIVRGRLRDEPQPAFAVRAASLSAAGLAVGVDAGAFGPLLAWAGVTAVSMGLWWRCADQRAAVRWGWIAPVVGVATARFAGMVGRPHDQGMVVLGLTFVTALGMLITRRGTRGWAVVGRFADGAWRGGENTKHVLAKRGRSRIYSSSESHVLGLGPSRSGKTRGLVIPNALAWSAGSLVVASTKQDVLRATLDARLSAGNVHLLDVLGVINPGSLPPGVHRVQWSPLRGCADWSTARARAAAMMGASRKADVTEAGHWATQGERVLAPVLHAAALSHESMSTVMGWIRSPEALRAPLDRLDDLECDAAADQLRGVLEQEYRQRSSVISTVATSLHAYAGRILDAADAAVEWEWDPRAFLAGSNTLYVVAPLDSQVEDPSPIVVGVLAELYGVIRATSDANGGRLAVPARWILDEVANISPLPQLPQWLAECAGRGLTMMLCAQDVAQLEQRWGRAGAMTMWTNLRNKVAFPGIANPETLRQLETLGGKHLAEHENSNWSSGGPFGAHRSEGGSRVQVETPTWPAAKIHGIAEGMCLVYSGGEGPSLWAQAR